MYSIQIEEKINQANIETLRSALKLLLKPHTISVFAASKLVEHEIAAFNALKTLGYISNDADEFNLVEKLRVTKAKARSLLYQAALREISDLPAEIDAIKKILSNPRMQRDGDKMFLVEVPQPLTMDRLRSRVRTLGFLTDGSFSGSVARMPEAALVALVESLVTEQERATLLAVLISRGLTDTSWRGVLQGAVKKIGSKVAGQAGEAIADECGNAIGAVFLQNVDRLMSYLQPAQDTVAP